MVEPVKYPCADYKPGDDDLQSFDFIRKFELDVNLDGYPGVARVRGESAVGAARGGQGPWRAGRCAESLGGGGLGGAELSCSNTQGSRK